MGTFYFAFHRKRSIDVGTYRVGFLEVEDEVELADLDTQGGGNRGQEPSEAYSKDSRAYIEDDGRCLTFPK